MALTITAKAKTSIVQRILHNTTYALPQYIGWGTGSGETSVTNEGLFSEVVADGRPTGTVSSVTVNTANDTLQINGTLTSIYGGIITNIGVFDNGTSPYSTTLQSAVTSVNQTSITVVPGGQGTLPSAPFDLQILSEVMTVTNISGNTWTVTRGVNGSSKLASIPLATTINTVSGIMFAKANFVGLPLNAGDSVNFNIKIEF